VDCVTIDKIVRSKRRTLALEIARDASLIIRAPKKAPLDLIETIVLRRRPWIEKKQAIARQKLQQATPKKFVHGEGFLYLGDTYRLSIVAHTRPPVSLAQDFLLSSDHSVNAREAFITWYKKEAYALIKERLDQYSCLAGFRYNRFTTTNASRCWGSCTFKGDLRFSWRLIMAPLRVIDYVVVHELVHLEEKSHSRRFWGKVARLFPAYRECKTWLKDFGHMLVL